MAPSEPYRVERTRATARMCPSRASRCTNRRAARMGPTVCELDGPMPILKRSKTPTAMIEFLTDGQLDFDALEGIKRVRLMPVTAEIGVPVRAHPVAPLWTSSP